MLRTVGSATGVGFLLSVLVGVLPARGQEPPGADATPTPAELWAAFQQTQEPFAFEITGERVIPSETTPGVQLRRIDATFVSQTVPCPVPGAPGEWRMEPLRHDAVILLPDDPALLADPARQGKVVIVAGVTGPWKTSFLLNYGDTIVTRTGYPTMVVPNPGEVAERPDEEYPQSLLMEYRAGKSAPALHSHFRWAVPYLRAADVMADVLGIERSEIRAIIGGHSKRATGAYTAAAIDPDRIAGVVFMGNESQHPEDASSKWWAVSPNYTQDWVRCPILYVGGTNERGYAMFDINRAQAKMKVPWTVSIMPNYPHATECEKQFLAWPMWVAHVFDGRPITTITDLETEETETGTYFRARIDCPNTLIYAHVWVAYCDDVPLWRDLMWHPFLMRRQPDGTYQAFLQGKTPDAWLVEVEDAAMGHRGYVTSPARKLTDVPVERPGENGWLPRAWAPKG